MSEVTTLLKKMRNLCDTHNGADTFRTPVTLEQISAWETENRAKLCDELKEFYLFTNSMDLRIYFSTFCICPLEKLSFKEGGVRGYENSEDYMKIGSFVGDGSVLCIDREYNFCSAYEGTDIEICSLAYLLEQELESLEERIQEEMFEQREFEMFCICI